MPSSATDTKVPFQAPPLLAPFWRATKGPLRKQGQDPGRGIRIETKPLCATLFPPQFRGWGTSRLDFHSSVLLSMNSIFSTHDAICVVGIWKTQDWDRGAVVELCPRYCVLQPIKGGFWKHRDAEFTSYFNYIFKVVPLWHSPSKLHVWNYSPEKCFGLFVFSLFWSLFWVYWWIFTYLSMYNWYPYKFFIIYWSRDSFVFTL